MEKLDLKREDQVYLVHLDSESVRGGLFLPFIDIYKLISGSVYGEDVPYFKIET